MTNYREMILKKEEAKETEMKKNILVTLLMCAVVSVMMLTIQFVNARLNSDRFSASYKQANKNCIEKANCTSSVEEDESNIVDVHNIILFRLQQFMQ